METENTGTIIDLERSAPRKAACLRRKIIAVVVLFGLVVAAAVLIYGTRSSSDEFEMDEMLFSPNFTGIVTDRWRVPYTARGTSSDIRVDTYHLWIYGRYVYGDEQIVIDRNFRVTEEMYNQYRLGGAFTGTPPD